MANLRPCDIELGATLIERREDMKRILGANYDKASSEIRAYLPAIHERYKGVSLLASVIAQAKEMDRAGQDPNMLFCAFLDELEARNA